MLRLKQIIDELGITQQTLADKTGWSKAQISLTLNKGIFPQQSDRFRVDLAFFAKETPAIWELMQARNISIAELFSDAPEEIANEFGEFLGLGPEWACADYGQIGHDYQDCRVCLRRYEGWLDRARGRAVVMGGT